MTPELTHDLTQFLRLAEHKLDQRLQGQYTEKQILGMLLQAARGLLLKHKIEPLDSLSTPEAKESPVSLISKIKHIQGMVNDERSQQAVLMALEELLHSAYLLAKPYIGEQDKLRDLVAEVATGGWTYINSEADLPKHGGQVIVSWGFTKDFSNGGPFSGKARWEKAYGWTFGNKDANDVYIYAWRDFPECAAPPVVPIEAK